MATTGIVYLVGAGPGDPGLLTLAGRRCLEHADVVVYDYLANPCLLDHAPAQAERILAGKHGDGVRVEQSVVNELLITHARAGRTVVRLKGGDPFVFGRGGEEAEALAAAGVPFEVVPGVTAAIAVPAYAGIPLTHRDIASSLTILTGYEYPDKPEMAVHWDAVARRGGTLVFLMSTRQLAANMDKLIAAGIDPATPVAVIRWGTRAEHETIVGTVATIGRDAGARQLQPPALAVVGDVVRLRDRLSWYERKPLFGRRIVVTRPRAQAAGFIDALAAAGADVVPCPTIEIVPPPSWQPLDDAIARIANYDWLVLTSVNGVDVFFDRLRQTHRDVRALHRARVAAVGPSTAEALANHGILTDVVPEEFRAEGVAQAMRQAGVVGQRVLLPRAAGAREVLPLMLRDAGAIVDEVASYQSQPARTDAAAIRRLVQTGAIDLLTFTSSSTVRNFLDLVGEDIHAQLRAIPAGCIGPITAETAAAGGLRVMVQPAAYTVPAFLAAIIEYFGSLPRARQG
ncbi:MAG TPA: uroporphyrinogen-III C-methyltransferase [Candidatus Binatia bacterium]|nr:uroporphyrinogen-III C-methyltransferase [Candidatus Binatia bacterium]